MSLSDIPNTTTVPYDHFEDDVIAFDGYICMYQFITGIRDRDKGDYIRNSNGQPISHLLGILNRFGTFLEHGVRPVFILDGGYPDLKSEEAAERAERTEEARQNYEEAKERGDKEAMQKWGPQRMGVTDFMLDSTREVFEAFGIPVVQAPTEGEPQAAQLVKDGVADYAYSEDFDLTMYHPSMVRNLNSGTGDILDFAQPLMEMGWEHEQYIWYGMMLGTDYNTSPYYVGPKKSKEIVNAATSFEDLLERAQDASREDVIDPDRWHETYEWFQDPDVDTNVTVEHEPVDPDVVRDVLIEKYHLKQSQVDAKLEAILDG